MSQLLWLLKMSTQNLLMLSGKYDSLLAEVDDDGGGDNVGGDNVGGVMLVVIILVVIMLVVVMLVV